MKSTKSVHAGRLSRLKALVAKAGVDRLLVTSPRDVGYLTGFLGGDSYLLVGPAKPVVVSDFRYREELEPVEEAGLASVVIRRGAMSEAIADLLASDRAAKVGIQSEHLTVAQRAGFAKAVGANRIVDTAGIVAGQRLIKDDEEIRLISHAAKIQEAAIKAVLPTIEPGQTELEIAAALEAQMKSRGSSEPGFQSIVAAGANGSLPHYRPGKARTLRGRSLLIDWGAVYQGYHSDMTRVFALGKWPPKIREIYEIVLEAQQMSAAALAPGKTTAAVDAVAREHIAAHGYGEQFGHGLGHGLGLDGHEEPRLSHMTSSTVLQPGMVVTVEPGIYLPGIGGVRIEDDYVITPQGARNLCTLPKDLAWATL
ncbi:MAG: aminopeptidase P family protein [Phycisphaeraceae bacterium]|nr:aminopeptidase P family protein [Phycisphaeraceae bacterium]